MAYRYTQRGLLGAKFNHDQCAAEVYPSGRWPGPHQCLRKRPEGSEWCATHDPEAEKKRREDSDRRYQQKMTAERTGRISWALRAATTEQLTAELKRRKRGGK
jgi:hypothetical protein